MKPSIWLRIAAVLEALGTVGHNLATLSTKPTHGALEQAVFDAMRGFQFDIMGSTRSTWDFYRGYQFSTTVTFVLIVVLLWLLSNMSNSVPREAKSLVLAILIAQLFNVAIGCEFFFAGPGVVGGLIALCLAMAVIGLYRAEPALEQSDWSTHRAEITRWERSSAWLRTSNSPMTFTSAPRSPKSGRGS